MYGKRENMRKNALITFACKPFLRANL